MRKLFLFAAFFGESMRELSYFLRFARFTQPPPSPSGTAKKPASAVCRSRLFNCI